jgi:hypothetical protein
MATGTRNNGGAAPQGTFETAPDRTVGLQPNVFNSEAVCALDLTREGISGDRAAVDPEYLGSMKLAREAVSVVCGACAVEVIIDPADGSATTLKGSPCIYK